MTINNQQFVMVADDSGSAEGSGSDQPQASAGDAAVENAPVVEGANASPVGEDAPQADAAADGGGASMPSRRGGGGEMPDFSNMSEEELAQMRESRGSGDGQRPGSLPEGGMPAMGGGSSAVTNAEGTLRAVTTGIANDDYVQILSGLSVGETVLYQSSGSDSSNAMMMGGGGGGMMTMMF